MDTSTQQSGDDEMPTLPFGGAVGGDASDDDGGGGDPLDEDFAGDECGDVSEWVEYGPCTLQDFIVAMNPFEDELLEQVEKEWQHVLTVSRAKARTCGYNKLDAESVSHIILKDFIILMSDTMNQAAEHHKKDLSSPITTHDVAMFLETENVCAFVSKSPTKLYKSKSLSHLAPIPEKRYFEMYALLSLTPDEKIPYEVPEIVKKIEIVLRNSCKWCYSKHAVLALDDDKQPISGIAANYVGIASRKIKKNFSPVCHVVSSVLTSLFLTGHLEKVGDKVDKVVEILLLSLKNESHFDDVKMNNLITRDRGYNYRATSVSVSKTGAKQLGTRKKEKSFIFTFGSSQTLEGQRLIPESGADGVYLAKTRAPIGNHLQYAVASRKAGRVTLLTSTGDCWNEWHSSGALRQLECGKQSARDNIN